MPILLENIRNRFVQRLRIADGAFDRHVIESSLNFRFDCYALQEGLLSSIWQSWNNFCRDVLIASAQGANTAAGIITLSPYSGRPDAEITYISTKLSRNHTIGAIQPLAGRHLEPTWGDSLKLNRIAIGINASNSGSLVSAFSGVTLISDLQKCRNACAHLNKETVALVVGARVRYDDTSLRHPSQMMFWSDPVTKDFAWKSWIDEMILVSDFAVL